MIETTCRTCRRIFSPTRDAILAGTWRLCPVCRDGEDALPRTALEVEHPDNCCGHPIRRGHIIDRCSGCEWSIGKQPKTGTLPAIGVGGKREVLSDG